MRDRRRPRKRGPYPMRVVDDTGLYQDIMANAKPNQKGVAHLCPDAMGVFVRLWLEQWEDWAVGQAAQRAQLFLGCIRKELGRRSKLDPNQLRLMKGI